MEESAGAQGAPGATGRIVIVMPTYNERQNLEIITGRVRESVPDADLLVVDDNSPDGTGDLADKLAETDSHVQVMHRTEKAGLGRAYVAGFSWALEHGYHVIVEMDADGSHRPEDLPRLLAALDSADAVIGSRYVPGGTVVNWPKSREFLSRGANIYNRVLLGISIKDATGGFRVYRASTLRRLDLNNIESAGYCFQIDMTLRVLQAGLKLTEVPITFVERERGASKMSSAVIREAFFRVAQWGITARLHGRSAAAPRRKLRTPPVPPGIKLTCCGARFRRCGARLGWQLRRWHGPPWRAVP
jgi:dolichol-phosphate mannosyltransferase